MPFSSQHGSLFQQNSEQFDFNVDFEQVFFSIIPSTLFLVAASWRTVSLARKPAVVKASVFRLVKVVCLLMACFFLYKHGIRAVIAWLSLTSTEPGLMPL